jgi:hypothetical protein
VRTSNLTILSPFSSLWLTTIDTFGSESSLFLKGAGEMLALQVDGMVSQAGELHEENKAHFQDRIQAEEQGLKQKSYWNKSIRDQLYFQYQDNKRRHSTLLRLQVVKTIEIKQPQPFCLHHSSV